MIRVVTPFNVRGQIRKCSRRSEGCENFDGQESEFRMGKIGNISG
jgi:hypothetical protein